MEQAIFTIQSNPISEDNVLTTRPFIIPSPSPLRRVAGDEEGEGRRSNGDPNSRRRMPANRSRKRNGPFAPENLLSGLRRRRRRAARRGGGGEEEPPAAAAAAAARGGGAAASERLRRQGRRRRGRGDVFTGELYCCCCCY
jgi:hypothetical protein